MQWRYYDTNTSPTATPKVIIAFVGNISPTADVDRVSIAGIVTYNAESSSIGSKYTEQKLITVNWGDGTSTYLVFVGIFASAGQISRNAELRREFYKSASSQLALLKAIESQKPAPGT